MLAAPTANITGNSLSGNVVRFFNVTSTADFGVDSHAQHNASATLGLPNDTSQTTYVTTVLPIELVSFSATVYNSTVLLYWSTATEANNYGFEVLRRFIPQNDRHSNTEQSEGDESRVGFVAGNGTTNAPKEYSFTDKNTSAGRYSYRLKQIDRDGKFEYSKDVEVIIGQTPATFALSQNYPNPFNPSTTINYQLPVNGHVSLKIYDVIGREVATVVNAVKEAGYYSETFDASLLVSGIYFVKLQSDNNVNVKKMLLMK